MENELAGLHKLIHKQKRRIEMLEAIIIRLGGDTDQSAFIIEKRRQVLDRKAKKKALKKLKAKTKAEKPKQEVEYKWEERYNHPLWRKRRQQIIRRDNFKCTECNNPNSLHVHHLLYQPGLHVWEYPDQYLITLCEKCHEKKHEGVDIQTFINRGPAIPRFNLA